MTLNECPIQLKVRIYVARFISWECRLDTSLASTSMYRCGVQWSARSASEPRKMCVADALSLCGSWASCLCPHRTKALISWRKSIAPCFCLFCSTSASDDNNDNWFGMIFDRRDGGSMRSRGVRGREGQSVAPAGDDMINFVGLKGWARHFLPGHSPPGIFPPDNPPTNVYNCQVKQIKQEQSTANTWHQLQTV